jgi:glyoxylase-like metal-dependent hydrolase (beta-lactamase superfamily II)
MAIKSIFAYICADRLRGIPSVPVRIVAAALLAGACALAAAQTPVRGQPVLPGTWIVQGDAALGSPANRNFISNAGIVATPAGTVVIDALGSPRLAEELIAEAERLTGQPVRMVIVTHFHADHIYGLQSFRARGISIVGQAAGRAYLQSDTAALRLQVSRTELAPWIDARTELVGADRWITQDTVIELGGERFHLVHAGPAHTPEDLVVLAEKAGVLFAGDLVFRGRVPFVGQADSGHWITALQRLLTLAPKAVVPGHGPASFEPRADLELTRDYLQHLRRTMGEAAQAMEPFDEAYAKADWSRFEKLPLFRMANRMNAYNTYLLMEQQGGKPR